MYFACPSWYTSSRVAISLRNPRYPICLQCLLLDLAILVGDEIVVVAVEDEVWLFAYQGDTFTLFNGNEITLRKFQPQVGLDWSMQLRRGMQNGRLMAVKMGGSQNLYISPQKISRGISCAIHACLYLKYVIAMFLTKITWRWKHV